MQKLIGLTILVVSLGMAQTAETRFFRAVMSSENEVPPIAGLNATGNATLQVHVVRNAAGEIISGSVDFLVNHTFPAAATFTGLHIHPGAAGVNGGVTINTGISAANNVVSETGRGRIERQAQIPVGSPATAFATLNGLFTNPSGYYVNLHTTVNTGGAIRGQLIPAEVTTVMGVMSPANEVPPVASEGSAVGTVTAIVTRDGTGVINSAEVIFDVSYDFPGDLTFTGLHIHPGRAGVNGGVVVNSGLAGQVPSAAGGRGRLQFRNEMVVTNANTVAALEALSFDPTGHYINIHSTTFPGGIARAQARQTDTMTFPVNIVPSNEVPPIEGLDASAASVVTIHTLRNEDGTVAAGHVVFDVNYRFPGQTEFVGLHVHDAAAGVNGLVRLDSAISATNSITSADGFGNIYLRTTIADANGLATLNSLIANPELHYLNLHTTVNRGGAVRAQLMGPRTGAPIIGAMIPAVDNPSLTTGAAGGLISLYGANFARVETNLAGWDGSRYPGTLNGVTVNIDGSSDPLPLSYVSGTQVIAQLPVDAAAGNRRVTITAGGQTSAPFTIPVATTAPALFTYSGGVIAFHASNFTLIGPGNGAAAGDTVVVYATGLGQTTPALATGVVAGADARTGTVTATIGGRDAEVVSSVAAPGLVGVYAVTLRIPTGVAAGNAGLVLRIGGNASNTANIAVR